MYVYIFSGPTQSTKKYFVSEKLQGAQGAQELEVSTYTCIKTRLIIKSNMAYDGMSLDGITTLTGLVMEITNKNS